MTETKIFCNPWQTKSENPESAQRQRSFHRGRVQGGFDRLPFPFSTFPFPLFTSKQSQPELSPRLDQGNLRVTRGF
jgi:hypothetical protein